MEPPAAASSPAESKSGCAPLLKWLAVVTVVLGSCGVWFEGHDLLTKWTFHQAHHFTAQQWKEIYDASLALYQKHAEELKTKERVNLTREEIPAPVRDARYEEFFATPEGVTYERRGGGVELYFTAIHCVFALDSGIYDRRGIWFLGPEKRDWVYEAP